VTGTAKNSENLKMKTLVIFFISFLALCTLTCKKNPVAAPNGSLTNPLQLTVQSVTCTEAFLKFSLAATATPRTLTLKRGDSSIVKMTMMRSDSSFVDTGLSPNKTYTYTLLTGNWSVNAQATPPDTTSHNWTWEVDTFGLANSYLYDIAIVNDTLAYAVGEIYIKDSLGNFDQNAYNVLKWNGKSWQLTKVMFPLCDENGNDQHEGSYPAKGIFAFSANDIWISCVGSLVHWDGKNFQPLCMSLGYGQRSLGKMWGVDGQLYLTGTNGFFARNNGSWQQIKTNLTTEIHDVWGGSNSAVGNNVVLAPMCNKYYFGDARLLKLSSSGTLDSIQWGMQLYPPYSAWFTSTSEVYVCGGGIFRLQNGSWVSMTNGLPSIFLNRVRGNADNDLFVVGDFGVVAHYNGVSWQVFNQLQLPNGNYESVAVKNNLAIAAGWYNGQAYIAVGRR